jgi:predicted nucleotidyltransferase
LLHLRTALQGIYGKQTPQVLIYGSHARGEANSASDVDVLLLYPKAVGRGQEIIRLSGILAEINLQYQVLISILPASQREYRQAVGVFWQNLRREGLSIEAFRTFVG